MKEKSKSLFIALAASSLILLLIFVSSAASAAPSSKVTETQITTNPSNSENPDIYGNTIVWQDDRNGNWDIYIFDLSTREEIHTTNKSDQINPAIYGSKVVWEDKRNGGSDIYLQDLSTKMQTRITTSGKAYSPRIYGNTLVWQDERNGNWDIYMYDIAKGKETQITDNKSNQTGPDIFGDRIVWRDDRNIGKNIENTYGHPLIYMYNVSTSVETPINYEEIFYFVWDSPRIYGDRIVWMAEGVGTNYNIYIYDLSTSKTTMIEPPLTAGSDSNPAIYGNRIVWTRGEASPGNDNNDIYMYDLSTSTGTQITTSKYMQGEPAIYGDRIVWVDDRNGNLDIYMGTLGKPDPLVAALSASPTSGKVPLIVKFRDISTGSPSSWYWKFGDGSTSKVKNPEHKYANAGKYTVTLTVTNAAGTKTVAKSNYITVLNPPVAAFNAYPQSGKTVKFRDLSTGSSISWDWKFGDGSTSKLQNPVHKYPQAGKKYAVSLTVRNSAGVSNSC